MTRSGLEILGMLLIASAAVWVLLFSVLPALARARFELDLLRIRDGCVDGILDGVLPVSDACVREFVSRVELLREYPGGFTLANLACMHLAIAETGVDVPAMDVTYSNLSPRARNLMHGLEARLSTTARHYLLTGSFGGWLAGAGVAGARLFSRLASWRGKVRDRVPSTKQLVSDYEEIVSTDPSVASPRRPVALGR